MTGNIEYKKAAIHWLLLHGETNDSGGARAAIARLVEDGIDYERSETPTFQMILTDMGDSFTEATQARAVAATIVPANANKDDWRDRYDFFIPPSDLENLMLSQIILGVVAQDGPSWEHRFSGVRGMRGR